jgi:lysophospholipase L1-like esterase
MRRCYRWTGALVVACSVFTLALSPPPVDAAARRKPGPLRVLLIGDSITGNYGPSAALRLRLKGYQVTIASTAGSGLLDENHCRAGYARAQRKLAKPDIVVMQSAGNYKVLERFGVASCPPDVKYGTPEFYARWEKAARKNQKVLSRRGTRFLWILNPVVAPNIDPGRKIIPRLNEIYRRLAPPNGVADAYTAFGGATYDPSLRQPDGLHLNAAGASLMADVVVRAIG